MDIDAVSDNWRTNQLVDPTPEQWGAEVTKAYGQGETKLAIANAQFKLAGERLAKAKQHYCVAWDLPFEEFVAGYCTFGRSKAYELLALSEGRTTLSGIREQKAKRQERFRQGGDSYNSMAARLGHYEDNTEDKCGADDGWGAEGTGEEIATVATTTPQLQQFLRPTPTAKVQSETRAEPKPALQVAVPAATQSVATDWAAELYTQAVKVVGFIKDRNCTDAQIKQVLLVKSVLDKALSDYHRQ